MIDYKKTCKWELGRYYEKLMAIDSLQDEIDTMTTRMEGIRSPKMDATPVQGGSSTAEERIINAICNRDNLTVNHELVKWQVRQMDRGLSILTDQQRRILEVAVMRRGLSDLHGFLRLDAPANHRIRKTHPLRERTPDRGSSQRYWVSEFRCFSGLG